MNTTQTVSHFNVFIVEEFDAPTKEDRNHKALPVNGRLVTLPPNPEDGAEAAPARDSRARR
jgi:hypothetical protein